MLDYTICHPCATSYVGAASRTQLYTAAHTEREKEGEYKEASEAEGYALILTGCIRDIQGFWGISYLAFGQSYRHHQELVARRKHYYLDSNASSFRAFYAQRFSIALMRGNARIIRLRDTRDMKVDGREGMEPPARAH